MKRLTCLFFNFAGIAIAAAQDDTKNSTINVSPKGDSNWYASPWLWVIAARSIYFIAGGADPWWKE